MPFDLEWTGQSHGNDVDRERAIDAATTFCQTHDLEPANAWADNLASIEAHNAISDDWSAIEWAATQALAQGWPTIPENVSLVWN